MPGTHPLLLHADDLGEALLGKVAHCIVVRVGEEELARISISGMELCAGGGEGGGGEGGGGAALGVAGSRALDGVQCPMVPRPHKAPPPTLVQLMSRVPKPDTCKLCATAQKAISANLWLWKGR